MTDAFRSSPWIVIGSSRSDMPHGDFREMARKAIEEFSRRKPDEKVLTKLLSVRARVVSAQ